MVNKSPTVKSSATNQGYRTATDGIVLLIIVIPAISLLYASNDLDHFLVWFFLISGALGIYFIARGCLRRLTGLRKTTDDQAKNEP